MPAAIVPLSKWGVLVVADGECAGLLDLLDRVAGVIDRLVEKHHIRPRGADHLQQFAIDSGDERPKREPALKQIDPWAASRVSRDIKYSEFLAETAKGCDSVR